MENEVSLSKFQLLPNVMTKLLKAKYDTIRTYIVQPIATG